MLHPCYGQWFKNNTELIPYNILLICQTLILPSIQYFLSIAMYNIYWIIIYYCLKMIRKTGRYQKFDRTGPATSKPAGPVTVCRFLPVRFQVCFHLIKNKWRLLHTPFKPWNCTGLIILEGHRVGFFDRLTIRWALLLLKSSSYWDI